MRACPYCAEQIQDAAIVCRFCGRDVAPVSERAPGTSPGSERRLPTQRWYAIDDRIKAQPERRERERRSSIWAKIGGALQVLGPSELRPGRAGRRETMVRRYRNVRDYRADVGRLIRVGWVIQHQDDGDDEQIVVTWLREPRGESTR